MALAIALRLIAFGLGFVAASALDDAEAECLFQIPAPGRGISSGVALAAERGETASVGSQGRLQERQEHAAAFRALLDSHRAEDVKAAVFEIERIQAEHIAMLEVAKPPHALSALSYSGNEESQEAYAMADLPTFADYDIFNYTKPERVVVSTVRDDTTMPSPFHDLEYRWMSWIPWLLWEQNLTKLVRQQEERIEFIDRQIVAKDKIFNATLLSRIRAYSAYSSAWHNTSEAKSTLDSLKPKLSTAQEEKDRLCRIYAIEMGQLNELGQELATTVARYKELSSKVGSISDLDSGIKKANEKLAVAKSMEMSAQANLDNATQALQEAIKELNDYNKQLRVAEAANAGSEVAALTDKVHEQATVVSKAVDKVSRATLEVPKSMQVEWSAAKALDDLKGREQSAQDAKEEMRAELLVEAKRADNLKRSILVAKQEVSEAERLCANATKTANTLMLSISNAEAMFNNAEGVEATKRSALNLANASAFAARGACVQEREVFSVSLRRMATLKEALEHVQFELQGLEGIKHLGADNTTKVHSVARKVVHQKTEPTEPTEAKERFPPGKALPWLVIMLIVFVVFACVVVACVPRVG